MTVKIIGDEVLRKVASPVEDFNAELRELSENMIETMLAENGIGLAAPQVDVSKRLIVALQMKDIHDTSAPPMVLVNPETVHESKETWAYDEGCLSIPGISAMVMRPRDIEVKYQDLEGRVHSLSASDMFARILQHEMDHLDGTLFIDYLSSAQKSLLKSKLKDLIESNS